MTAAGTIPWVFLSLVNVRTSPHVPWAGPLTAVWLWLYWRYLLGHGPPRATAALRRERLQIRPLAARTWGWALLATTSGFAALIAFSLAASRVAPILRRADVSELDRYPFALVITGLVMTAVVAAVSEEAGFRGYMQSALDRRLGTAASTALVAAVFGLIIALTAGHFGLRIRRSQTEIPQAVTRASVVSLAVLLLSGAVLSVLIYG